MTPLRQRMTEDMQLRNLSPDTQRSYLHQISQLARYFKKSPDMLGPPEIRSYQLHLIQERELAPSSLLGAVSAIRFFYNVTLQRDWRLASNRSCTTPSARWRGYETSLSAYDPDALRLLSAARSVAPDTARKTIGRALTETDPSRMGDIET